MAITDDDRSGGRRRIVPIRIPAIYCPVPSAIHPKAAEIDERSIEYMNRFGLGGDQRQRLRLAAGMHGLAGHTSPLGNQVMLQVLSDLAMWIFAFDDMCDESSLATRPAELIACMIRMQRTIETPELAIDDTPYTAALRDIRIRLDSAAKPAQVQRWVEAMRGHFLAEAYKVANAAAGLTPNLSDYVYNRLYAAGAMAFVGLLHIAEGIDLPASTWEDRRICALTEMADSIAIWDTDIFSAPKERHRSGDNHNLVDAIGSTYGHDQQQALIAAVAMRDRVMCRFLRLRREVIADQDPLVARYLQCLAQHIRGVLDWCLVTHRYKYLDGLGQGPLAFHSEGCSDTPSDGSSEPLQIPSIAWWWAVGADTNEPHEGDSAEPETAT